MARCRRNPLGAHGASERWKFLIHSFCHGPLGSIEPGEPGRRRSRPATSGQQPAVEVRPSLGVCDGPGALIERPTASGNFTTGCQPAIDSMRSTSSRVSSIP